MRFQEAVLETAGLAQAFQPGLQALKTTDRKKISCKEPRMLLGSINLDKALAYSHPNDPRWDYGLGHHPTKDHDHVTWVEVHPASSRHIDDVLAKLTWLRGWLKSSAPMLNRFPKDMVDYVWVASGRVSLPANSPQRRKLAKFGLRLVGGQLDINKQ